jgi:hypothetical protein
MLKTFAALMIWLGLAVAALMDAPDAPGVRSAVASVQAGMDETAPTPEG